VSAHRGSTDLDFIVPGDPAQRTGGYLYDARIVEALRHLGWTVTVHGLPGRFPDADPTARDALHDTLATLPAGRRVVIDGLALGGLPEVAIEHAGRLALVALVHHPLADERGLDPVLRRCLLASERAALAAVRLAITTSAFTARRLLDFGLRAERIRWVEPGVAPLALAAAEGEPPQLLCVASLTPRKGQDVLVRALERVRALPWRCTLIGSTHRDPGYAGEVAELVRSLGLQDRIRLSGECADAALRDAYAAADLMVGRSGAGTVMEAATVGLPVIFVPLPHGNGEQARNADFLLAAEAAVLVADADLSGPRLVREVQSLIGDSERLAAMGERCRALVPAGAARALAELALGAARKDR